MFMEFEQVGFVAVLLHLLIVWTWTSYLSSHFQYLCGEKTVPKKFKRKNQHNSNNKNI